MLHLYIREGFGVIEDIAVCDMTRVKDGNQSEIKIIPTSLFSQLGRDLCLVWNLSVNSGTRSLEGDCLWRTPRKHFVFSY